MDNRDSILSSTLCTSNLNNQINNNTNIEITLLEIIYGLYSLSLSDKKIYCIIKINIFYSSKNILITKW